MIAVFDTCILVDYLQGIKKARTEMESYDEVRISLITWMEIMAGAGNEAESGILRRFLSGFRVMDVSMETAETAVDLRRRHRIKIPDAIIWATAKNSGFMLVTRNTRDFPKKDPGIRVPYRL